MKIKFEVTVDVDPEMWANSERVARDSVRADVISYVRHQVIPEGGVYNGTLIRVVRVKPTTEPKVYKIVREGQ